MHNATIQLRFFTALITILTLASQIMLKSQAFTTDAAKHTLTVSTGDTAADTTKDIQNALNTLINRSDPATRWILHFNSGEYHLSQQLYAKGLQNVTFQSDLANPAILSKDSSWSTNNGENLLYLAISQNLLVQGFTFYGTTDFKSNSKPVWTDQGLSFQSTHDVTVDKNKFYNFGNSAIRITTYSNDPVLGVNSSDSKITNNYFKNIFQIATTSDDTSGKHGGTTRLWVQNNTFDDLQGSIKAASKTPGCTDLHYTGNTIHNSNHYGFEIASCSDVEIRNNTIDDVKEYPITLYTNVDTAKGFAWGDNTTIAGNTIRDSKNGIRFSPGPYPDKFQATPKNLVVEKNKFINITDTNKHTPALTIANGTVDGVHITGNQFTNVASQNYLTLKEGSRDVIQLDNLVEGKAFGPQSPIPTVPVTGSTTTDTAPTLVAPSDLTAQYDGKSTVNLHWTDNSTNETEQQIWMSTDSVKYKLLTKVSPNATSYVQALPSKPAGGTYYYTVRSVWKSNASRFSKVAKVVLQAAVSHRPVRLAASHPTVDTHPNQGAKD